MPEKGPVPDDDARKLIHGYHAAVSYMDAQVGRVLAALEKNGPREEHDRRAVGRSRLAPGRSRHVVQAHELRGGGAHSAHRGRSAGEERAARKSASLVESVDIYPTLCAAGGLTVPQGLDGASFAKLIGRSVSRDEGCDLPRLSARQAAWARGADRAVSARRMEGAGRGCRDTAELELYDYEADPGENKNLAAGAAGGRQRSCGRFSTTQPEAKPQIAR